MQNGREEIAAVRSSGLGGYGCQGCRLCLQNGNYYSIYIGVNIGIMENKMETTIMGSICRSVSLRLRPILCSNYAFSTLT